MDGQDEYAGEEEEETYINVKKKIDVSKTFSGTLSSKINILLEAIDEIDQLIELRKVLSRVIQERIGKDSFNSECQLIPLKPWQLGHNPSIEMRRIGLEKEILSLSKEKRNEEVRSWEHISNLLKLRRQFLIEYENLLATKKLLEGSAP